MNSDSKISMGNTLKKKNKINEKAILSYQEELDPKAKRRNKRSI